MPNPKPLTPEMDELPISEEAIDLVEATMFALENIVDRTAVAQAVIRAFLQAEGFEVEHIQEANGAGTITNHPDGSTAFTQKTATTKARLVGPWKPEQGTDSPSSEGQR